MAQRRVRDPRVEASPAVELSELAASVAEAVLRAKERLDRQTAAVAERYRASPALALLSPPAFAIGEVRVSIRFAIAGVDRPSGAHRAGDEGRASVRVIVAAPALAELAPHLVSELEVRVAPEPRPAPSQPVEAAGGDDPE